MARTNKDTLKELNKLSGSIKFYEIDSESLAFYVGHLRGICDISKRELDILLPRLEKCYRAGAYDLIPNIASEIAEISKDLDLSSRLYVDYELRYTDVYASTYGQLPIVSREKEEVGA